MATANTSPDATTIPDPEQIKQPGITDATRRKLFFVVVGVAAVIVLANIFSPTTLSPPGGAPPPQKRAAQTATPQQMQELKDSIDSSTKALQTAIDQGNAATNQTATQRRTLADLQAADALRDAQNQREIYKALHPEDPAAGMTKAERAAKSLSASNRVTQAIAPPPFRRDGSPAPPTSAPSTEPAQAVNIPLPPIATEERPTAEPKDSARGEQRKRRPLDFDPAAQPVYWLPEGTVIECELTNKLDGEQSGPVNVMVTTDVYKPGTRLVLIPAGARGLGEAHQVEAFGQQRLAVSFHRILTPGLNGYGIPLDKNEPGLGQAGETGLHDKVNAHYLSIFGAAGAVGAIGGLAQIGNNAASLSTLSAFRNGVSASTAQSADRILDRFLNRLPTITIRPGTRVRMILTDDLSLPAYHPATE